MSECDAVSSVESEVHSSTLSMFMWFVVFISWHVCHFVLFLHCFSPPLSFVFIVFVVVQCVGIVGC
jgi:hypothetical protein